jgi:hypothetical protein
MRSEDLGVETACTLLSNPRRLWTVRLLARRGGELPMETLTREVTVRTSDGDPDAIPTARYRSVNVSLYQTHVPRLAEADVVRYDGDSGTVHLVDGPRTRRLLRCLDEDLKRGRNRRRLAVAVPVGAAALVAATPPAHRGWVVVVVLAAGAALVVLTRDGRERKGGRDEPARASDSGRRPGTASAPDAGHDKERTNGQQRHQSETE